MGAGTFNMAGLARSFLIKKSRTAISLKGHESKPNQEVLLETFGASEANEHFEHGLVQPGFEPWLKKIVPFENTTVSFASNRWPVKKDVIISSWEKMTCHDFCRLIGT